jgi:CRP/FNR family transcriptional regulator, cyclic AMP receptor protein
VKTMTVRRPSTNRFPFLRLQFEPPLQQEFEKLQVRSKCPAGAVLFEQGADPAGMYIILSGTVKLYVSRDRSRLLVRVAGPGEAVGVIAAVSNRPYVVTAVASQACEIAFISQEAFHGFMNAHPAARLEVLKFLTHEVSGAYQRVRALARGRAVRAAPAPKVSRPRPAL